MAIGKLPANTQANAAGTIMEKPTSAADKFAQKFMIAKCVEMVRAFRSHPSVIEYCYKTRSARTSKIPTMRVSAMQAEDPSRCIVL